MVKLKTFFGSGKRNNLPAELFELAVFIAERSSYRDITAFGINESALNELKNHVPLAKTNISTSLYAHGKKLDNSIVLVNHLNENIFSNNLLSTVPYAIVGTQDQIQSEARLSGLCKGKKSEPYGFYISGYETYKAGIKPTPKSVQAIITLYNEVDIISQVVRHLLNQEVDVHIIDNWSNDGSYELIAKLSEQNAGVTLERFPSKKPKYYQWADLLGRVQNIANVGGYDWYIHYDADEIRTSPWQDVNLKNAISFVDSLGYNTIDFTVLDFRPIKDGFNGDCDPEEFFDYCEFGKRPGHFIQVKAWKKTDSDVEIVNSGGHEAAFANRRIYPIKFITKHYPLRSTKQAKSKIFNDRLPRIAPAEKKKGWHIQYNDFDQKSDFIWSKDSLIQYTPEFRSEHLIELISGIGNNPNPLN
jgi:glycosyltransferase involved in cell wall biosynthesis